MIKFKQYSEKEKKMANTIYKFETDMLKGKSIYVSQKRDSIWARKHWHNYYELVYFKRYLGSCTMNGEKYPIYDGCLFLLTPKDFHEITTQEAEDQCALIVAFDEHIADPIVLDALTKGPFVSYDISQSLGSKLDELYDTFGLDRGYQKQYVKHLFNCILIEVIEKASAVADHSSEISPIVRDSISLMLSDPTAELSLAYFAKKFNVTGAYFSRLFHKHAGVSFKQYLTSLRLEYAKQLLEEASLPIIGIGYDCGFNTPSQFYRAFKKKYCMTPSEYRNQKKASKA